MPIYQTTKPQHETKDITGNYKSVIYSTIGEVEITKVTSVIFHKSDGKYRHIKFYGMCNNKAVFHMTTQKHIGQTDHSKWDTWFNIDNEKSFEYVKD